MNILSLEIQIRGMASALVGDLVVRPAAVSSIKSIIRTVLAILCCSFLVIGPVRGQSDGTDIQPPAMQKLASPVTLASGTYQGIWRDEDGLTGQWLGQLKVDGQSIKGKMTVVSVEDYSGDKISGKTLENDDGTMGVEFKTRDRKWKSKGVFDGQLLMGTYSYEISGRRGKKLIKGEWAAQRVPDDS